MNSRTPRSSKSFSYREKDSGYERVLRSLVLESSERIRCIAGTAIGVTTAAENANRIDSVLIRTPSGGEMSAPAALVIGQSILYQRISKS